MIIYGLSGKSGTGKSYHAPELCGKLGISTIIDDGLLIHGAKILAGKSAKKADTKIGAVKRALFVEDDHCLEMRRAIKELDPANILILGTSDQMVERIAERLGLPEVSRIIHIEDITSKEERDIAVKSRDEGGMHVIPAPTFQVKRQFSGYFINAKKGLRRKGSDAAKTIIRPTFSYMGSYNISEKVIGDIVGIIAKDIPGISNILWVSSSNDEAGMFIRIILLFNRDALVKQCALELQRRVSEMVAQMTSFNMLGVNVEIHGFKDEYQAI